MNLLACSNFALILHNNLELFSCFFVYADSAFAVYVCRVLNKYGFIVYGFGLE